MNTIWPTVGLSAVFLLVVVFAIGIAAYLLRTWFAERIRQSIKHNFDLDLEQYKSRLNEVGARHGALHAAANAALIEGQRVSAERRIKAADTMWREMMRVREKTSTALTMLDILRPEEYQLFVTRSDLNAVVPKFEDLSALASPDFEQVRPFLGEKLYAMGISYKAVLGRIWYLLQRDVENGRVIPWFQDIGIQRLLCQILTTEEMGQFKELKNSRVTWTRNVLEQKLLYDLRNVIAGTQSVNDGLEQGHRILKAVQQVESRKVGNRRP